MTRHVSLLAAIHAILLLTNGAAVNARAMASGNEEEDEDIRQNEGHVEDYHRAFPIVEPDNSHTHLRISKIGLDAISRIKNPIAVVAVIGPYRSGKSFLLNQLLSLSCNEGFGVGHMRDTKTKGVWVWGEPLDIRINGVMTSVLFLDTEGFESLGKSTVYDDRIFALAAIVSSVLIYNLPETGRKSAFQPGKLLWLIQRDFLEGKSVQQMVEEALRPVPNEEGNEDVEQVNRIRTSLAVMAANGTAFGLRQPHLMRTKLCDMTDSDLDVTYVTQRNELRQIVTKMVAPKLWAGRTMEGREFANMIEQTLEALNDGTIPSAGSIVEVFNRGVRERAMAAYHNLMASVKLPLSEEKLNEEHETAARAAREFFEKERFGHRSSDEASQRLEEELLKADKKNRDTNALLSSRECELLYARCEDNLEYLSSMRIPSMAKFDAGVKSCNESAERDCRGPSREHYVERLGKMCTRERSQFEKEYNQRLFNWLVVASLVLVAIGRFLLKSTLIEVCAWALFVFLEAYTRIFWSVEGLYYNKAWRAFVGVWEAVVFNPVVDVDRWAVPIGWFLAVSVVLCRCYPRRRRIVGTNNVKKTSKWCF